MHPRRRPLVTEAEFLALPESTDRVELLDGEIVVSPSPNLWHQEVLQRIVFELRLWQRNTGAVVTIGQAPQDIRFGRNRILQPDAFVACERLSLDLEGPLDRVPELCIEVVSTDRVYDRVTKRIIYAEHGVREYWLVERAAVVERWSGAGLVLVEEVRDRLETPLLPGFALDLAAVFAGISAA